MSAPELGVVVAPRCGGASSAAADHPSSSPAGFLVVDKPGGITSHDVVATLRRALHLRRIGHTGTLDPMATGVLVLCVGSATRLARYVSSGRKQYRAEFTFGIETDTQDNTGVALRRCSAAALRREDLERQLPAFRGAILQIPPMVSARRHNGVRLYELARAGDEVDRAPVSVQISELLLEAFTPGENATAELIVTCSSGVYIRTLAHDIGQAMGCGAVMSGLRRTWVGSADGPFTLSTSTLLPDLERPGAAESALLPLATVASMMPIEMVDEEAEGRLMVGRAVPASDAGTDEEAVAALSGSGRLVAVCRRRAGHLLPETVMPAV
ncbi:MAG: tRNA pseudouridine(55) synthase TruB [Armatimonadetes bacterium]|nr:tRNA pseudouridine(55) synthase TruB [Armatimonadota bacterium]MDE2206580.1 tRNA pseudouridine(55) synthase TruB [Armatimonadota bacterium]